MSTSETRPIGLWASAILLLAPPSTWGQVADYWPMEVGNRWEYRHSRGVPFDTVETILDTVVLEITGTKIERHSEYYTFNTGQLMRVDKEGQVWEFNNRFGGPLEELRTFDFRQDPPPCEDSEEPEHPWRDCQNERFYFYRISYSVYPPTIGGGLLPQELFLSLMYRETFDGRVEYLSDELLEVLSIANGDPLDLVAFSHGDALTSLKWIVFLAEVGPVASLISSDQGLEDRYTLISAAIGGQHVPTLAYSTTSWARLKARLR